MNHGRIFFLAIPFLFLIILDAFAVNEKETPPSKVCLSELTGRKPYSDFKQLVLEMEAETDKRVEAFLKPYWEEGELATPPREIYAWNSTPVTKNLVGHLERQIYQSLRKPLEKFYAFNVAPSDFFLTFDDNRDAIHFMAGLLSEIAHQDREALTVLENLSVRWKDGAGHHLSVHIEQESFTSANKTGKRILVINEDTGYAKLFPADEDLIERLGMKSGELPGTAFYLPELAVRN